MAVKQIPIKMEVEFQLDTGSKMFSFTLFHNNLYSNQS